jgi:autotransporter-associated beta strand protein
MSGASWVGSLTQNATTMTVGSPATNTNGYGVTDLNLNASAMTYVRITARRDVGNLNPFFVIQFEDPALNTAVFSVSSSAFNVGTLTQVQIPVSSWGFDFVQAQIAGWSIGGGDVGTTAFRMTIDHLAMSNALLPLTGGGTIVTAGNQVYTTAVNLDAATTLGSTGSNGNAITFNSTINGLFDLVLNTLGITTLGGAVGQSSPLGSLVVSGGAAINGGVVRTTNAQSYNGAVSLGANTLFESSLAGVLSFGGPIVGNNHDLEIRTGGSSTVQTASGLTALTKSGAGTLTLLGASTYSGRTTIAAGTLALGVNNALPLGGALTLSGGTLALNSHTQTLGLLTITANSTLNFGGAGGTLVFGNSAAQIWNGTLTITNYSTASNSFRSGNDGLGLTALQLGAIRFADYGNALGQIDTLGFITPSAIPEPSTYGLLAGVAGLLVAIRRRRNRAGR